MTLRNIQRCIQNVSDLFSIILHIKRKSDESALDACTLDVTAGKWHGLPVQKFDALMPPLVLAGKNKDGYFLNTPSTYVKILAI